MATFSGSISRIFWKMRTDCSSSPARRNSSATCKYWARASLKRPCWVYSSASFRTLSSEGLSIAHILEALGSLVGLADSRIQVAYRVQNGQVFRISFEDLFVFGDGVLQLALLDIFLRSAENLLFIKSEAKRHISADSKPSPRRLL